MCLLEKQYNPEDENSHYINNIFFLVFGLAFQNRKPVNLSWFNVYLMHMEVFPGCELIISLIVYVF